MKEPPPQTAAGVFSVGSLPGSYILRPRPDAEGAAGAGTDFIGVLFGYGTREEMEEQGGRKFTDTVDGLRPLLFEE